jgi:hypothetical protein
MPIFRRTNCIITAAGIVALCKGLYSMPDENRLLCSLLSSGIPWLRFSTRTEVFPCFFLGCKANARI